MGKYQWGARAGEQSPAGRRGGVKEKHIDHAAALPRHGPNAGLLINASGSGARLGRWEEEQGSLWPGGCTEHGAHLWLQADRAAGGSVVPWCPQREDVPPGRPVTSAGVTWPERDEPPRPSDIGTVL